MTLKQRKPKVMDGAIPKKTSEITVTVLGTDIPESQIKKIHFPDKFWPPFSSRAYVSGHDYLSCFVQVESSGEPKHFDWCKFDLSYSKLAKLLKTYRTKGEEQLIKQLTNEGMDAYAAFSLAKTLMRLNFARFLGIEDKDLDKKHMQTQLVGSSFQFKSMFGRKLQKYLDEVASK